MMSTIYTAQQFTNKGDGDCKCVWLERVPRQPKKKEDQDALVGSRDVCCKRPDMALASEATGAANFGLRRDCGLLEEWEEKKRGSGCLFVGSIPALLRER